MASVLIETPKGELANKKEWDHIGRAWSDAATRQGRLTASSSLKRQRLNRPQDPTKRLSFDTLIQASGHKYEETFTVPPNTLCVAIC